jgi:hypothetical protein
VYQKAIYATPRTLFGEQSAKIFENEEAISRNFLIHTERVETEESLMATRDKLERKLQPLRTKKKKKRKKGKRKKKKKTRLEMVQIERK